MTNNITLEVDSIIVDILLEGNRKYVKIKIEDEFKQFMKELYKKILNIDFNDNVLWIKLPFRYGRYEKIEMVYTDGTFATSNNLKKDSQVKIRIYHSGNTDKYICWNALKIMFK